MQLPQIALIFHILTYYGGLPHLSRTLALRRSKGTGWRPRPRPKAARSSPTKVLSSRRSLATTLLLLATKAQTICQTTRTRDHGLFGPCNTAFFRAHSLFELPVYCQMPTSSLCTYYLPTPEGGWNTLCMSGK